MELVQSQPRSRIYMKYWFDSIPIVRIQYHLSHLGIEYRTREPRQVLSGLLHSNDLIASAFRLILD